MNRPDYRSFRPVVLAGADYREAESDAEFLAAREELARAIVRWFFCLAPDADVAVRIEVTDRGGENAERPGGWRAVVNAIIEWPDEKVRFGEGQSAPWWRLYAAARRWAAEAVWYVRTPAEGKAVASC